MEQPDLLELLARSLGAAGQQVHGERGWLRHGESGFLILPELVDSAAADDGGVRTLTTIRVTHPELLPEGAFEYQHAAGDTLPEALTDGFDNWIRGDFVTLCDAVRAEASTCQTMVLEFPEQSGGAKRRAVLGPAFRYAEKPQAQLEPSSGEACEHDFCPCCLLTQSFQAFTDFLRGDSTYCLRLYAARHPDGPGADCRINGQDYQAGIEALIRYAETWPEAGVEFRKQYVVIHSLARG